MKANNLVSVVIPIYKVEKYLEECVESVLAQTYTNIEVILVDDKSPDKSGVLCDELARRDNRIKVIHKSKNEGLNMARKTGFDASKGQYVTFLDSDDSFCRNTIEKSLKALKAAHAQVVVFGSIEFTDEDDNSKCVQTSPHLETRELADKRAIANYAFHGGGNLQGLQYITVWGKLYVRAVVEGVDWKVANYRAYEDNFWTPQALLQADKVVLISEHLIHYRRNLAYGTNGINLGNKLVGNSLNGKPVGYIEFIDLIQKFYTKLLKRYELGSKLDEKTLRQLFLIKSWRVDNLAAEGLTGAENNLEYIARFLDDYITSKNAHIANLDKNIEHLRLVHRESDEKIAELTDTLEGLHGIKRSAKLLLGNLKRKITK